MDIAKLTDREWTQEELWAHARALGIEPEPGEIIPQGVKWLTAEKTPLTPDEIAWAERFIAEQKRSAGQSETEGAGGNGKEGSGG